jgi:ATP-binding cassette subfamily B protein
VIIGSFVNIVAVITILPQISVITKRINEILKSSDEDMNIDIVNRTNKKGVIEFKNVSFKYNDAVKNVLNEINFKIDAGEIVGIIGPMGSGKTTLINLIPSLLKPTSGTILVDGIDIKKSNLVKLRRKIGYSSQNSYILNATVKENISPYENKNLRFDKMRLIAKISNADNFINKLEGGYNSILLRGGNNLSGGQKQRISITRSISKDNEILLFDDSFSALDYANDLDIRNKISKKYKKATKIIVATRISTIINADKIILLNEGKIIDIGKHNELFKRCKQYKNLVLSQITLKEAKNA